MTPKRRSRLYAAMAWAGCAFSLSGASAAPVSYTLVPERSWVSAEVLHFGTSTIRARFGPLQGQAMLDSEAQRGEVGLEIDTAAVSTGFAPFDARLRRADLLASAEHPKAWFVASQWQFDGDAPTVVRGEFTLRGVSRPLALRVTRFACRTDADGRICGAELDGELQRSAFGADFGVPLVADTVRLVIQVEARAQR